MLTLSNNTYDVVVIGAGTSGVVAATAAASTGAKTCLVESSGYLGGTTYALGNVVSFHNNRMTQVVSGFPQKLIDLAARSGGVVMPGHLPNPGGMCGTVTLIDSSTLNLVAWEALRELGVEIMLHSLATGVEVEANQLRSITVTNKGGARTVTANCFVDASGDADVAVMAGARYEKDAPGSGLSATMLFRAGRVDHQALVENLRSHPQNVILLEDLYLTQSGEMTRDSIMAKNVRTIYDLPYIYLSNMVRDYIPQADWPEWGITGTEKKDWGQLTPFGSRVHFSPSPASPEILYVNMTNIHFDPTVPAELSRAEGEAQRQVKLAVSVLKRYIPGFKDAILIGSMPKISVRASRRVVGEYQMTQEDVTEGRRFPDGIARGCYPMSIQSTGQANVRAHVYVKEGGDYDIPYRSLIPLGVDRVLVAGRCISATREASGSTRTGAQCMAYGHAAGTAAALSAMSGITPRQLDPCYLRETLTAQGAIL